MKRARAAVISLSCAFLASNCAVQGTPFEKAYAPANHATIYVYRPYSYVCSLLRPTVTCNEDTARIGPGGYHAFVVPAGQKIECSVQGGESADIVEIDAQPRVYYIKEQFGWGVLSGHPHLNPIDEDQAQTEIQRCCVQEPSLP